MEKTEEEKRDQLWASVRRCLLAAMKAKRTLYSKPITDIRDFFNTVDAAGTHVSGGGTVEIDELKKATAVSSRRDSDSSRRDSGDVLNA